MGTSSLPSTKDSRRAICQGLQTWSQKTTFAMLNTLYLHTSQSQSGHSMQYTRSFSLLVLTKTPSSTYNRLRELHKLLFYFIKDYWFKIKLCHDQSAHINFLLTFYDLMDLIVLESNILLKIIFLLRQDILIDVLLIDFVLQLQTILKTTIWPCQQSSDPYRY